MKTLTSRKSRARRFENQVSVLSCQFSVTTKNRARVIRTRAGRPARVKVCKEHQFFAMGRRVKDRGRLRTMPIVYEIIRGQDRSFDIFHNGELEHSSVPDGWLEDELAKHGICGIEYREVRRQLLESGKAKLSF